jgi:elongation factor Ts
MELLKQLREMTGAGMVDCKKALDEAGNDLTKAVEILRKKGISKAAKRSGRETNEGIIKVAVNADQTKGYILELNSETDFVARNEKFQTVAESLLALLKAGQAQELHELLALKMENNTVEETLGSLSGTMGEKLDLQRFSIVDGATVAAYSHLGGRMGVLVALDQPGQAELAMNIAMQIAAANPKYILPSEVAPEEMAKEKEIYKELLIKEGKPAAMVDKIVEGKMGKYYSEVCLTEQEYIKDDKKKIKDLLGGSHIIKFVRYAL